MRIGVSTAGDGVDAQTRAYAEYRLFSRLGASRDAVTGAAIALVGATPGRQVATCSIAVSLDHGGSVRVSAHAPHIYEAIDQAVEGAAKGVHAS